MDKIKSYKQAEDLARKIIEDSTVEIQLWDELHSSMVIESIVPDDIAYLVHLCDRVTGECFTERHYFGGVETLIFNNRRFINQSGQLEKIGGFGI